MSEKYLKLGENASSFYDPQTGFGLVPGEVKPIVPAYLKVARIRRFLKGGGLTYASKEEYNEYLASLKAKTKPKIKETEKPDNDLGSMKLSELKEYVSDLGWDSEDIEKAQEFTKKADLISFIEETEAQYGE